jgi:hypothetical protein
MRAPEHDKYSDPRTRFAAFNRELILNRRAISRRSRAIGVFPSAEAQVRLIACYLIEYAEDWETERNCIREDKVQGSMELAMAQAGN